MSKKSTAILLDDNPDDLKIAERLTRAGLPCDALDARIPPDQLRSKLYGGLESGYYDLVLLDYRLDDVPLEEGSARPRVRGGTIAAELRDLSPATPVVLVTTEDKLRTWLLGKPLIQSLFDFQIMKSQLITPSDRKVAVSRLILLRAGYKLIAAKLNENPGDTWQVIRDVLGATDGEAVLLRKAVGTPPAAATFEVAGWILSSLMSFSGPLIDADEARIRLGLTKAGFQHDKIQKWLAASNYSGVLAIYGKRWWRGRLETSLGQAITANEGRGNRAQAIAKAVGIKRLNAEVCDWCGESNVTRACAIHGEATDARHSLAIMDDAQPRWVEPNVACFRCIQVGRAEKVTFQSGTESLVEGIKTGRVASANEQDDGG